MTTQNQTSASGTPRTSASPNPSLGDAVLNSVHSLQQTVSGSVDGSDSGMSPGVVSLESPLVQQTKSEIRILAGEIAELAHSGVDADAFYHGFLPRLVMAMGASASAIWQVGSHSTLGRAQGNPAETGTLTLLAEHALPSALFETSAEHSAGAEDGDGVSNATSRRRCPTAVHERILRAVIVEGQPILVPPSSIALDAERPANPLTESLIIVPVRTDRHIDYVLEVVQQQSGGPAAQRGYLRFVAQMADLMADFFRRQRVREISGKEQRLSRLEHWLVSIADGTDVNSRAQRASEALSELFEASQTLIVQRTSRRKLLAISGTTNIDPRSEIAMAALKASAQVQSESSMQWFYATDRRTQSATQSRCENDGAVVEREQAAVDALCDLLRCRQLMRISLTTITQPGDSGATVGTPLNAMPETSATDDDLIAWLSFDSNITPLEQASEDWQQGNLRLAGSFGRLILGSGSRDWTQMLTLVSRTASTSKGRNAVTRWLMRGAVAGLLAAVALFPAEQQVTATAILKPANKSAYYAPVQSTVQEVFAVEGQMVAIGDKLMQLSSAELDSQILQLEGELSQIASDLRGRESQLNQGPDPSGRALTRGQLVSLMSGIQELKSSASSRQQQLRLLTAQRDSLTVVAQQAGVVSSWDVRSRLVNRPVAAGQKLLCTFEPDGKWTLQLTIPEHRAGLVASAIAAADENADTGTAGGAVVKYSLSSHPSQVRNAWLSKLSSQAVEDSLATPGGGRVVLAEAKLDADALPMKKDGALARATVDCGRVPFAWLVMRDAYSAVSSWVKLLW